MIPYTPQVFRMHRANIRNHILFWFILWLLLVIYDYQTNETTFSYIAINQSINVFFYCLIVYINWFYLIPRFLANKQFGNYLSMVVLSVLVITPIKVFILFTRYAPLPELKKQLLDNQVSFYILHLIITLTFTVIKIFTDWMRQEREKKIMEKEHIQTELKFLKSQINPHFLFNTLNSLYALTLKNDPIAPDIVLKLSDIMRYILYECNEKYVRLERELSYIRNYLDLEQLRHGPQALITLEVKGQANDLMIAPMIFIPFLENSFKHGLLHNLSEGFVHVQFQIEEGKLWFKISNSKPTHYHKPTGKQVGGIGLNNIRRRLDLLYPDLYKIDIENAPSEFHVEVQLQLDKNTQG